MPSLNSQGTPNPLAPVEAQAGNRTEKKVICFFKKQNYKVSATVGQKRALMRVITPVLDSGAGPNLIHLRCVADAWRSSIKSVRSPPLIDASNRSMKALGEIYLTVRIGEFTARVPFLVVTSLAVDCILGTTFLDRHVKAILPPQRKIIFHDAPPVALVGTTASRHDQKMASRGTARQLKPADASERKRGAFPTNTPSRKIRLVKGVTIPPMTQAVVEVATPVGGLCFLQNSPKTAHKNLTLLAQGVMDVIPEEPFSAMLSNFGHRPIHIPKHTVVGLALPSPTHILTLGKSAPGGAEAKEGGGYSEGRIINSATSPSSEATEAPEPVSERMGSPPKAGDEGTPSGAPRSWEEDVHIGIEDGNLRGKIVAMLVEFKGMWTGELGKIGATKHRIELKPDARPIYQAPYRAGPSAREKEKTEIDRMLRAGVIEPATAEWACPVVFVPKKDGTMRFCVDYRRLNAVTVRDSYPLPRMDECIDSLGDATVFTTLDCNSGYWQVEVAEEDRDKTTFASHCGLYRFIRMPFGLKNAPATFQRAVDIILSRVKWETALVYLDDVIIYSRTVSDHLKHVREVLRLLRDAGVSLKISKCAFFDTSVTYLGHVIRPGRLEVERRNVVSIERAQPPRNQTELRSFLGMCNVYRRFVKGFAKIAAPLNRKTGKDQPFEFEVLTDEEYEAFEELKKRLISPPILALPRYGKRYTLDTDACGYQVGCALLQEQPDGTRLPIGYWSRALSSAEKNYTTTEKECLAVVWSILTLRPYLYGNTFNLRTDHEALRWVLNLADSSGRLARWRLRLAEYDYEVQYRPGVKHQLADGVSRLRVKDALSEPVDDEVPCFAVQWQEEGENPSRRGTVQWVPPPYRSDGDDYALAVTPEERDISPISIEEFLQEQAGDPFCQSAAETVGEPASDYDVDRYGFLVRKSPLDGTLQRVVPKRLRAKVLYLAHHPRLAGHPGGTRMYYTLRREYYWPHMANDAYQTVRNCASCAATRGTRVRHQKDLKLFPAAGPLEFVAMDLLGPLPKTTHGNRHVLVMTDRFTKLTRSIPLRTTTASVVASAFLDHWVYPYGAPRYVLTDNGPQFAAKFFDAVACALLGVRHYLTTAYHPQTNGQTERFNRTLVARLRHYVEEHQRDWDDYVQPLTFAYNTQVHRSTETTPFDLVLTRAPSGLVLPGTVPQDAGTHREDPRTPVQYKRATLRKLRTALECARGKLTTAQERYKASFDRKVRYRPVIVVGDYVYVDRPPRPLRRAERDSAEITDGDGNPAVKLLPKAEGPFRVRSATDTTVVIDQDGVSNRVSIDRVTKMPRGPSGTAATTAPTDRMEETPDPTVEYVVERVVAHRESPAGIQYKVRWHGYSASDDTWEPAEGLPQAFIDRYWRARTTARRQ